MNVDLDAIIALSDKRSAVMKQADDMRQKRNENAQKMKGKLEPEVRAQLIDEGKTIKEQIAELEKESAELDAEYQIKAKTIPNYANPKAPIGKEDKDSTAVKYVGEPVKFPFKALDHVQIGQNLDLIDFDTATAVSGPKFYYLKNQAVLLQMGLERYAMDIVLKHVPHQ